MVLKTVFLLYRKILGNKTTSEISFWLKTPSALIASESRLRKKENRGHGFVFLLVGYSANKLLKATILLVQELIK